MNLETKAIIGAVEKKIEDVVNVKIDAIHKILVTQNERADTFEKKVDLHIAQVEPFIQAKVGLTVLFKWLLILAAGVVAWGQIKLGIK
jgi:hypothetical protein